MDFNFDDEESKRVREKFAGFNMAVVKSMQESMDTVKFEEFFAKNSNGEIDMEAMVNALEKHLKQHFWKAA